MTLYLVSITYYIQQHAVGILAILRPKDPSKILSACRTFAEDFATENQGQLLKGGEEYLNYRFSAVPITHN